MYLGISSFGANINLSQGGGVLVQAKPEASLGRSRRQSSGVEATTEDEDKFEVEKVFVVFAGEVGPRILHECKYLTLVNTWQLTRYLIPCYIWFNNSSHMI